MISSSDDLLVIQASRSNSINSSAVISQYTLSSVSNKSRSSFKVSNTTSSKSQLWKQLSSLFIALSIVSSDIPDFLKQFRKVWSGMESHAFVNINIAVKIENLGISFSLLKAAICSFTAS